MNDEIRFDTSKVESSPLELKRAEIKKGVSQITIGEKTYEVSVKNSNWFSDKLNSLGWDRLASFMQKYSPRLEGEKTLKDRLEEMNSSLTRKETEINALKNEIKEHNAIQQVNSDLFTMKLALSRSEENLENQKKHQQPTEETEALILQLQTSVHSLEEKQTQYLKQRESKLENLRNLNKEWSKICSNIRNIENTLEGTRLKSTIIKQLNITQHKIQSTFDEFIEYDINNRVNQLIINIEDSIKDHRRDKIQGKISEDLIELMHLKDLVKNSKNQALIVKIDNALQDFKDHTQYEFSTKNVRRPLPELNI